MEILRVIAYCVSFLVGMQISKGDIKLLKGDIIYKLRLSNYIAYVCILFGLILIGIDIYVNGIFYYVIATLLSFGAAIFGIWIISKVNSKSFLFTLIELIIGIAILLLLLNYFLPQNISIPFIVGLYYRNNPFGAPFIKKMLLLQHMEKPQFVLQKSN